MAATELKVGVTVAITEKLPADVAVSPGMVTTTTPLVADEGSTAVIWVLLSTT